MLFKNIAILDENFNLRTQQDVEVIGTHITRIGHDLESREPVVDGTGRLLTPAFYNSHAHSPMTLMRGYGENMVLSDWLTKKVFPYEDELCGEDVYWATMLAMAESVRFGVLGTTDMYFFCEDMARAVLESGTKCNLSQSVTCFDESMSYLDTTAYTRTESLLAAYGHDDTGRLVIESSLHAEYTSCEKLVRSLADFTAERGLRMHVHVSETAAEHKECIQRRGRTPTKYLADCGIFATPTTAAHCTYVDEDDMDILAAAKVCVAHCPTSNLKLAGGIMPYAKLIEHGVSVSLGTDSVCSNNNLDMLAEAKLAAIMHKGFSGDPTLVSPVEAFRMATRGGALAAGRTDCGLVAEGYRADLLMWDISAPYYYPVHDLLTNIVYSGMSSDILMTMCDGQVLYANGEYRLADIDRIVWEVTKRNKKILKKLSAKVR